jgi:hypothetical protein
MLASTLGDAAGDEKMFLLCSKRFVFVNLDACMAAQGVTLTVLDQLKVMHTTWLAPLCL